MEALKQLIGERVLVRSNLAGVIVGTLVSLHAPEGANFSCVLSEARTVFYWEGAVGTFGIAAKGIDAKKSTLTEIAPVCYITDGIALLPVSVTAQESLWGNG